MTTLQNLLAETRYHILTAEQEKLYTLGTTVNDTTTSFTLVEDTAGILPGQVLGIELEEVLVKAASGTILTDVVRGYNGSTPVAHTAGVVLRKRFTDFKLFTFLNRTLEDLSADGLFRIKNVEFTFNPTQFSYNLNTPDLIDIWKVRYDIPGPTQVWPEIPHNMWRLDQDASGTDFANNRSLQLQSGGYPGHLVRVSYKAGFSPHTASYSEDTLTTTGLHTEAHKLPPLGAAIYILGGRDIKRTLLYKQPEPRRQEEVPPGSATQAMRPILLMYSDSLRRERRRLRRKYPDTV